MNHLDLRNADNLIKSRAFDDGLFVDVCNDTFRGTVITNYLEDGGTKDITQELAGVEPS